MRLSRLRSAGDASSLGDNPDTDAGIVDVPGHRVIVDGLAGEGGACANDSAEPLRILETR
jgi:hypothetical protein